MNPNPSVPAPGVAPPSDRLTDPDLWWQEYEKEYRGRSWLNYRPLLSEVIAEGESGPILDVGCGYGFLPECARRFGVGCIGIEASDEAIGRGRTLHPEADIRKWQGGEPLPFPDGQFGAAVINEFVDHISMEQNRLLFAELRRVLRVGGIAIVKSPSKDNLAEKDLGHISFFSPGEFRRFVGEFGFEVLKQPYRAQPKFGSSRLGQAILRIVLRFTKPEKWAARIDLVARKV